VSRSSSTTTLSWHFVSLRISTTRA
jgi:hypothetical protein